MNDQEYEVDLLDLCKSLCKRWKLVLLCTVIAAAAGVALSLITRPAAQYSTSALISVNVKSGSSTVSNSSTDTDSSENKNTSVDTSGESALLGSDLHAQEESATSTKTKSESASATVSGTIADRISILAKLETLCRTLLTQEQVLRNVADQCNTSLELVKKSVSVSVVKDTNLLQITASAEDPELAQSICNRLADSAHDVLMPVLEAKSIEVMSDAKLPTAREAQESNKKTVMLTLVGFVLACAYVVLDYLLNPKIRTEADVQERLGMKLLGTIPAEKERKTNG